MQKSIRFIPSRWVVRISAVASMALIPACSMPASFRQQPDHVFSARSPQELDPQHAGNASTAQARYPDQASLKSADPGALTDSARTTQSASVSGKPTVTAAVSAEPVTTFSASTAPAASPATAAATLPAADAAPVQIASADIASADEVNPFAEFEKPASAATPEEKPAAPAISQVSAKTETADLNEFRLASYQPDSHPAGIQRATFIASEPRQECPPDAQMSNRMETIAAGPMADLFPDEYVFDGGDRDIPVHFRAGDRGGLESEDTVAEFSDHTGANRIKPSNRVAIYSPRFGSIRTVTNLETDTKIDMVAGTRDALGAGNLKTGLRGEETVRSTGLVELDSRNRVDELETALPPSQASKTDTPILSRKVDIGHEDRKYTGAGELGKLDTPIISEQMQNAVVWTRNLFPQITVSTSTTIELTSSFKLHEAVSVEDQRKTKGDLQIIKLADRATAQSGDTVKFTIEFRNVGDFDVYDVRITDNLTPRLQYVEGSAAIDEKNPGEVTVTPNGEGSHILIFKLDNALKGHTEGQITFEARVR